MNLKARNLTNDKSPKHRGGHFQSYGRPVGDVRRVPGKWPLDWGFFLNIPDRNDRGGHWRNTSSPSTWFHSTRRRPRGPRSGRLTLPPGPLPQARPTPPPPGPGPRHPSGPFLVSVTFPQLRWAPISLVGASSGSHHFPGDIYTLPHSTQSIGNVVSGFRPALASCPFHGASLPPWKSPTRGHLRTRRTPQCLCTCRAFRLVNPSLFFRSRLTSACSVNPPLTQSVLRTYPDKIIFIANVTVCLHVLITFSDSRGQREHVASYLFSRIWRIRDAQLYEAE